MRRVPAPWTLILVVATGLTASSARGERTPASQPAAASQPARRAALLRASDEDAAPRQLDLRLRAPAPRDDEPRFHRWRPFVTMLAYQLFLSAEGWAVHSHWPLGWYHPRWSWWKDDLIHAPRWNDGDPWWLNYFGHAIFGSDHYLMARNAGWSWYSAIAFNTFGSTFWEYVTEGLWEHPSAIDLLLTPIVGSILGEARYRAYRLVRRTWGHRWYGVVLMCILDPTTMVFERALRWR